MTESNPIKLSAVIITFNEESNIGRCLDSLNGVADEILVIDSNSTDRTTQICIEKGVTVVTYDWHGYSGSKNYGNTLAKHDFILSIDADEALSDKLKNSISNIKKNPTHNAYSMNRYTNYCGKWIRYCGWYPDRKLRLWKRSQGKWEGDIHEHIQLDTGVRIGQLNGDLLHYSFPSIASHIRTVNKFSDVAAKDAVLKGKRINLFVHILLNPIFTFIRQYFFRLGFLDGYYGFVICIISSHANFLKYVKIKQFQNKKWKDAYPSE